MTSEELKQSIDTEREKLTSLKDRGKSDALKEWCDTALGELRIAEGLCNSDDFGQPLPQTAVSYFESARSQRIKIEDALNRHGEGVTIAPEDPRT
jgi:hypothetical protein